MIFVGADQVEEVQLKCTRHKMREADKGRYEDWNGKKTEPPSRECGFHDLHSEHTVSARATYYDGTYRYKFATKCVK